VKPFRPARLLLLALVAVAVTGCVKLDMDLTVSSDDTVDGTVIVAVSNQLVSLIPGGEEELLSDLTADFDELGSATVERYEDDRFIGASVSFEDLALADLSVPGGEGDFAITHEGERYRVTGSLDLSAGDLGGEGLPPGLDPQELFSAAEIRIAITLPRPIEQSNGMVDGCTVVWTPAFGESIELDAVTSDSGDCTGGSGGGSGLDWWAWLLIGLAGLVLVAGAVVAVVIGERRKRRPRRQYPITDQPAIPSATDVPPTDSTGISPATDPTDTDHVDP